MAFGTPFLATSIVVALMILLLSASVSSFSYFSLILLDSTLLCFVLDILSPYHAMGFSFTN